VLIQGKIRTEKYTEKDTGADRWITKIVVSGVSDRLELLGDSRGGSDRQPNNGAPDPADLDDEIPF